MAGAAVKSQILKNVNDSFGLTAKWLCDLIDVANVQVDGKTLSSDEKQAMTERCFYDIIELLAKWELIQENTKQSVHEIRKFRNSS